MRITLFITLALALAACAETGEAVQQGGFVSKSYGLQRLNFKRNPNIDDWNDAFATGGSE